MYIRTLIKQGQKLTEELEIRTNGAHNVIRTRVKVVHNTIKTREKCVRQNDFETRTRVVHKNAI